MSTSQEKRASRKGRKGKTEIFSIFGQIESVAAQIMIDRGELTKIEPADIPASAAFNEQNQPARFAVIVPADKLRAFNELIAWLRA